MSFPINPDGRLSVPESRPKYSSRTSTTDSWEDPLGAPDLHPGRGCVGEDWRECVQEDRSEAFDDVGFHEWCVDQA